MTALDRLPKRSEHLQCWARCLEGKPQEKPSIRGENSDIVDAIPLKSATYRDEATGIRLAAHTGGEKADFYIAHNLAVGYLF